MKQFLIFSSSRRVPPKHGFLTLQWHSIRYTNHVEPKLSKETRTTLSQLLSGSIKTHYKLFKKDGLQCICGVTFNVTDYTPNNTARHIKGDLCGPT